jgi:hypothetical protein
VVPRSAYSFAGSASALAQHVDAAPLLFTAAIRAPFRWDLREDEEWRE